MQVTIDDYGHGGLGVARVGGKVHFVEGALPGDVVEAVVVREKPTWARAVATSVLVPGPDRRIAPCPHADACGGCDLQQATEEAQRRWKVGVVVDQLRRLAGIEEPPVQPMVTPDPSLGYRNRIDLSVVDGRPALHRRSSHELVPLDVCLLLEPSLAEIFGRLGDLSGVRSLTLRVGVATGEGLAVIGAGDVPNHIERWGVAVCRATSRGTEVLVGRDHLHEVVAGTRLRITGSAFFQNSTAGAGALVALVRDAVAGRSGRLIDLYAGGGLFATTVGAGFDSVVAVEAAGPAVADLRHNTAGHDVEVHAGRVEDLGFTAGEATTVVVDPPRSGLGRDGVASVVSPRPERVVYVSCEPASFARDVALLAEEGFGLVEVTPVDLFPQTHHVETVAVLDR